MKRVFKSFAVGIAIFAICGTSTLLAQRTPKSITLTSNSNLQPKDILKALQKECPDVGITSDTNKSDYRLEAKRRVNGQKGEGIFDLTLLDRDGKTIRGASEWNLGKAVKLVCRAIKTTVMVEIVDTQTLTQSLDARASGGIIPALTGRRTHTDTSTIYVIANGEHATLDCYERHTGCTTIGPGKYYGELDGESIWVNYQMPLTHEAIRNHYRIVGSW